MKNGQMRSTAEGQLEGMAEGALPRRGEVGGVHDVAMGKMQTLRGPHRITGMFGPSHRADAVRNWCAEAVMIAVNVERSGLERSSSRK